MVQDIRKLVISCSVLNFVKLEFVNFNNNLLKIIIQIVQNGQSKHSLVLNFDIDPGLEIHSTDLLTVLKTSHQHQLPNKIIDNIFRTFFNLVYLE